MSYVPENPTIFAKLHLGKKCVAAVLPIYAVFHAILFSLFLYFCILPSVSAAIGSVCVLTVACLYICADLETC